MPELTDDTRTTVDAAAELAAEPAVLPVDAGGAETFLLPPGWSHEEHDHEPYAARPRRPRGAVHVHDADSFIAAVTRRQQPDLAPVIYADEEHVALVAVLNDDEADLAGWRDYRVELSLRRTKEWQHWLAADGQLLAQEAFADHVERGLNELREPDSATMLELAQTFHATTSGRFKGGHRIASGARQVVYEEEIDASAGATPGTVTLPDVILLAVRPFYGADLYEVRARFMFRLRDGKLTLGYRIDRPHEVERAAFGDVRSRVGAGLPEAGVIAGPAPSTTA